MILAYLTNLGRAVSRLGNAVVGGHSGEMISARAHRENWETAEWLLDRLFFWEDSHCQECFITELTDRDRPSDYHSTGMFDSGTAEFPNRFPEAQKSAVLSDRENVQNPLF